MRVSVYVSVVLTLVALASAGAAQAGGNSSSSIRHDRNVIRFFNNHPRLMHTKAGERALWRIMNHVVVVLATRQEQSAQVSQPAHAALWNCLMRYEGGYPSNQNTGGNGHWGGLQMHPGWGYGTAYHASDSPWSVQMNAAEQAYRDSGYSSGFLTQQWGQTINNCWQYA